MKADEIFLKKIKPLRIQYNYKVRKSQINYIPSKSLKLIDYTENDTLIELYKQSITIEEQKQYIEQMLSNFSNYFRKYIRLLKYDYKKALSKDTLQFLTLFYSKERTKDISGQQIERTCKFFRYILHSYTEKDLLSEFTIITIELMNRYEKREKVSFTQYFISMFRYALAHRLFKIANDLNNSFAFNDNTFTVSYLKKRFEVYHKKFRNSDLDISNKISKINLNTIRKFDLLWIINGGRDKITKNLTKAERTLLYKYYIEEKTLQNIAEEYEVSSLMIMQRFKRIRKKISMLQHQLELD